MTFFSNYPRTLTFQNFLKKTEKINADNAGLGIGFLAGIGSETMSDTWMEELLPENEEAIREAEARRKQEQLSKSLAALEKVYRMCSLM